MERQRSEFWVGLTVLAALGVFLWATFRLGACAALAPEGTRLAARFDDASGVTPRTEVTVAGVQVGEVERVALDGERARLVLRIDDPDVAIPVDSTVRIRSRGLLGERLIEIVPGRGERLVADGDTLTRSEDPPSMDRLLDRMASMADDVKEVTHTLRLVLGGAEGEATLADVVENVRVVSRELRSFVEDNGTRLGGALDNLERFSGDLARLTEENGQTVEELLTSVREVSRRMESTVDNLAAASERVERGEGTLGKLLNDEELYDSAQASIDELRSALREVRRAAQDAQEQLPVTVLGSVVGTLF